MAFIEDEELIVTLSEDGSLCIYDTKLNSIKYKKDAFQSIKEYGSYYNVHYNLVILYPIYSKPLIVSSGLYNGDSILS